MAHVSKHAYYRNLFKKTVISSRFWLLLSLIFFFSLSFLLRTSGSEMDETDHLAVASLMHDGRFLYADLFSHHFPLPYYWTYLFAFPWDHLQPYQGIILFRLSITLLYLIIFTLVAIVQRNERTRFTLAIWIVLFTTFFYLYRGNLVMSETYVGMGILGVSWLLLPIMIGWEKLTPIKIVLCHGFATMAFWSQPLSGLLFFPVFLFLNNKRCILRNISFLILLNIVPIIFLQIRGQLPHFFEQAFIYNFSTYVKNYPLPQSADSIWIIEAGKSFFINQSKFITHAASALGLSQLILHMGYLGFGYIVAKDKRWRYFFMLVTLYFAPRLRETKIAIGEALNYGIFPILTLFSIAFVLLLIHNWKKGRLFVFVLGATLIFLNLTSGITFFREGLKPGFTYHYYWSDQQRTGEIIQKLTKENEKILITTNQVDLYFFAKRQPADKFLYWYPWTYVVDEYKNERLHTLQEKIPALIFVGDTLSQKSIPEHQKIFLNIKDDYSLVEVDGVPKGMWIRKNEMSRILNL